jgi:hypothetical protein
MILNFEDEKGKQYFEFCFVGFVLGGSMQREKGMTILRREVGLFEKLESISEPKPCGKKMANGEPERQLLNDDTPKQLRIDMNEFDLLYNYLANLPWQTGTPARKAVETIDWLEKESKNGRS